MLNNDAIQNISPFQLESEIFVLISYMWDLRHFPHPCSQGSERTRTVSSVLKRTQCSDQVQPALAWVQRWFLICGYLTTKNFKRNDPIKNVYSIFYIFDYWQTKDAVFLCCFLKIYKIWPFSCTLRFLKKRWELMEGYNWL